MTNHTHTPRQLIDALEAFLAAHPDQADMPVGFTTDRGDALHKGEGAIWWVGNVIPDPDAVLGKVIGSEPASEDERRKELWGIADFIGKVPA